MSDSPPTAPSPSSSPHEPGAARVLERFDLDYCCGGRRTLADACAHGGLDPTGSCDALASSSPARQPDWAADGARPSSSTTSRPPTTPTSTTSCPGSPRWSTRSRRPRRPPPRAGRRPSRLRRAARRPRAAPAKEERVLFPMIRELAAAERPPSFHCGSLRNPISVMLARARRAPASSSPAAPPDRRLRSRRPTAAPATRRCFAGLAELEADTHLHIHKENNVLFPAVVALEAALEPPRGGRERSRLADLGSRSVSREGTVEAAHRLDRRGVGLGPGRGRDRARAHVHRQRSAGVVRRGAGRLPVRDRSSPCSAWSTATRSGCGGRRRRC